MKKIEKQPRRTTELTPEVEHDVDFLVAYFDRLGLRLKGATTLNEIRIYSTIIVASLKGFSYDNTLLSKKLGIPKATISRAVLKLIEIGFYKETVHPDDHRRRVLEFTDHGRQQAEEWLDWIKTF